MPREWHGAAARMPVRHDVHRTCDATCLQTRRRPTRRRCARMFPVSARAAAQIRPHVQLIKDTPGPLIITEVGIEAATATVTNRFGPRRAHLAGRVDRVGVLTRDSDGRRGDVSRVPKTRRLGRVPSLEIRLILGPPEPREPLGHPHPRLGRARQKLRQVRQGSWRLVSEYTAPRRTGVIRRPAEIAFRAAPRSIVWIGGCTRSKRSMRSPERSSPWALSFWPPLRYENYLGSNPREFGYSTIASGTVRIHLFASGPFCLAEASVFAISASAITDANSAIE